MQTGKLSDPHNKGLWACHNTNYFMVHTNADRDYKQGSYQILTTRVVGDAEIQNIPWLLISYCNSILLKLIMIYAHAYVDRSHASQFAPCFCAGKTYSDSVLSRCNPNFLEGFWGSLDS